MRGSSQCPCCGARETRLRARPEPHLICPHCGHRWRRPAADAGPDYANQGGRNAGPRRWAERKFAERASAIAPLLADGQRLLEVGCAEGELGGRLKAMRTLHYCGVEPSRDAEQAARRLDRVHRGPTASLDAAPFDGLLAFHVLEHIARLDEELHAWRRLLAADGWLMIEVPHRAGHPDLDWDTNPEHLHQFSPASLCAVLTRCAFAPERVTTGHFESPAYGDSLRVLARHAASPLGQRERMLARIRAQLPGAFLVRGTGGDYRKFIAPLRDALPIAGLLGEAEGERRYCAGSDAELPVLACSLRFEEQIVDDLVALGHAPERIVRLSRILGDTT